MHPKPGETHCKFEERAVIIRNVLLTHAFSFNPSRLELNPWHKRATSALLKSIRCFCGPFERILLCEDGTMIIELVYRQAQDVKEFTYRPCADIGTVRCHLDGRILSIMWHKTREVTHPTLSFHPRSILLCHTCCSDKIPWHAAPGPRHHAPHHQCFVQYGCPITS